MKLIAKIIVIALVSYAIVTFAVDAFCYGMSSLFQAADWLSDKLTLLL